MTSILSIVWPQNKPQQTQYEGTLGNQYVCITRTEYVQMNQAYQQYNRWVTEEPVLWHLWQERCDLLKCFVTETCDTISFN